MKPGLSNYSGKRLRMSERRTMRRIFRPTGEDAAGWRISNNGSFIVYTLHQTLFG
jgi:hypothetical protein